jgi:hypothetical protein
MKKLLSLLAVFTLMSHAPEASAELKLNGEAGIRLREDFSDINDHGTKTSADDQYFQYRIALKASADIGGGYYFKALIQDETFAEGWATVSQNNTEKYSLAFSQFYFGRYTRNTQWSVGRIPLGSFNNPFLDLTLYPIPCTGLFGETVYPVDTPFYTNNFDRLFGANFSTRIGKGQWTGILVNLDNASGTEILNDGYGFYTCYTAPIGNVTFIPQAYVTLTHFLDGRSPYSFGAQFLIPAGKSKLSLSGVYTADNNSHNGLSYDYNGYIFRIKGESGPFTAWIDYNRTSDDHNDVDYTNTFVWAQYNIKLHESASGSFSLTPTVRYRASTRKDASGRVDNDLFRTEVYATVTF